MENDDDCDDDNNINQITANHFKSLADLFIWEWFQTVPKVKLQKKWHKRYGCGFSFSLNRKLGRIDQIGGGKVLNSSSIEKIHANRWHCIWNIRHESVLPDCNAIKIVFFSKFYDGIKHPHWHFRSTKYPEPAHTQTEREKKIVASVRVLKVEKSNS